MSKLVINEGPLPRFVSGRLVAVGDSYDPEAAANSEAYVTASTPAGQLSVEQLEALLATKRGGHYDDVTRKLEREAMVGSTGIDATNTDVALAPTSPAALGIKPGDITEKELAALDRNAVGEEKKALDASRDQALSQLDHDKNGDPGGSKTKAVLAAELTAGGIEFDPKASRDELAKLAADKL